MNPSSITAALAAHSKLGFVGIFHRALALLAFGAWVFAAFTPSSSIAQTVNGHGANISKSTRGPTGLHKAHTGDVASVTITVINADNFGDTLTISNIFDVIVHYSPLGGTNRINETSTNLLITNLLFTTPNGVVKLAPKDTGPPSNQVVVAFTYIVRAGDEKLPMSILTDFAQSWTTDNHDNPTNGSGFTQTFTNAASDQLLILAPALCVSNTCLGVTNNILTFLGCVTNCGNTLLTNVLVSNFVNGAYVYVTNLAMLDVNEGIKFTRTYPMINPCLCSTLTAWGTDTLGSSANASLGLTVSSSATAACSPIRSCLGDFVWEDRNHDGIQNPSEVVNAGIANVPLQLIDCSNGSVIRNTNSGINGFYLFCDLLPGQYRVQVSVPSGYFVTISNAITDCVDSDANAIGLTDCIMLGFAETNLCVDIGLFRPAAIGDFVWNDMNMNGVQETNAPQLEPGVPNVLVKLMDCNNNVLRTTNTAANGRYLFTDLVPSNYVVMFVPPAGSGFTTPDQGGNDVLDSDANPANGMTICYTLASGETNLTVDAGLIPTACIGDFVWVDRNTNGIQETNAPLFEAGLPGVMVKLLNCTGTVLQTTNTDINGRYLFCNLVPGNYRVMFVLPPNYFFTSNDVPTDDCIDSDADRVTGMTICYTLAPGQVNLCVDAGLVPTNPCPPLHLVCPQNLLVECGILGSPTNVLALTNLFTPPWIDGGRGTVTLMVVTNQVVTNAPCPTKYSIIRVWKGTDECGTVATCSQVITVVDTTPPNISCGDNQLVECNQPFAFTPPYAVDACDGTNVIIRILSTVTTPVTPRCPGLTNIVRTWSASDTCGNSNVCSQTITIIDTTPPNITCAHDQIVECGQPFAFTPPFAVDACDGTNVTIRILSTVTTPVTPRCPGVTNIVRTWSASDTCGNSNVCSQTITIVDTLPPNITCADNQIVECGQPFAFTPPFAVDICDGTNVTIRILSTVTTPVTPRCPGVTNIVRTWSASDSCGNSNVCSQTITIVDTLPPNITCAHDQIVECGQPFAFTPPFAVDICDGTNVTIRILSTVTTPVTPRCPSLTNIVRTWSASDSCGNSNVCSQTITIVDTTPPNIECANNQIVECGQPFAFTPPFAVDICDGTNVTIRILSTVTTPVVPRCPGVTNIVRTWSASDTCGNSNVCSQTITIVDTTPPNITCADDQIVECGQPFAFTPPFAVDICDGPNVTIRILSTVTTPVVPRCPGVTNIVRTWSASDTCGNSNVCSQTITIVDTTPPNIACADDQIVECGTPFAFTPPFAVDVCDGTNVTIRILSTVTTPANPRCPALTNIVRTWSASDTCGNSNVCSQTITLVDTTPPEIDCAPNRTVECGTLGTGTNLANSIVALINLFSPPTAIDLCSGTNVTISIISTVVVTNGPCTNNITVTRTWRATDTCTNSSQCSQSITMVDTIPPVVSCPPTQFVECGVPWMFEPPHAYDLCAGTNLTITTSTPVTNLVVCGYVVSRTWTATDPCGNSASCNQTVLVQDTLPPVLSGVPANFTVECIAEVPPVCTNCARAYDLCDTNVLITFTVTTNGTCPMFITRTWTATDDCGNTAIRSQVITVFDITPPQITCPTNMVLTNPNQIPPRPLNLTQFRNQGGLASDNCQITNFTSVDSLPIPGPISCITNIYRTNTVVDICNNRASCVQVFTIQSCPPMICVIKEVACVEANGNCGTFSDVATGFKSATQDPGFCYRITVTNCGGITLTNLDVADNQFGNLTTLFFPPGATLPPGGTVTRTFKKSWPTTTLNTVIASGRSIIDGTFTTSNDTALAIVQPAGLNCNVTATSPDDMDGNPLDNRVVFPDNGNPHLVTLNIMICNTGAANLASVTITAPGFSQLGCTVPAPFNLPAGMCSNLTCTASVLCQNLPLTIPFGVSAVIDTQNGACAYDTNGNRIPITSASPCTAEITCTPCHTNCGAMVTCTPPYPFASPNPLTSVEFNESEVLRYFTNTLINGCVPSQIRVYYNDEHALTLGVGRVIVKTAAGTTTTDYPLTPLGSSPDSTLNPQVGTTALTGDQAGTDPAGRPLFPALYITDITGDPVSLASLAGDWQFGGTAIPPHAVFGTWKGAVREVDHTKNPPAVKITPNADPAKNNWNLDGGDPAPPGLVNQGFGAEIRWDINAPNMLDQNGQPLQPGHTYRLYFMVHDGDQNHQGGDVGQGCAILQTGGQTDCGQAALGDYVWNDTNTNGVQDAGEPGIPGVTVQLLDCATMNTLRTTNTDANGLYLFSGLNPGNYKVRFIPPAGFGFTVANAIANSQDAKDSDADPATGMTGCYTLGVGQINRTVDAGVYRQTPPGLVIIKSASQTVVQPGASVTYTYLVMNNGTTELNNIVVTDDNGTPGFATDDVTLGTVGSLPPGGSATFTRTLILPVTLCDLGTSLPSGMIISETLPNGNYRVSFIQASDVNDNTYGVNAIGWGGPNKHTFNNLVGSDHVSWQFRNGAGQIVLVFDEDYISAASTALFPSGYGCLGFGGDGKTPTVGSAASVLDFSTSLEENLNKQPFLGALAQYTVNSPALSDPNAPFWEYRMIYTVVLDKNAFGASGLGQVSIIDQHNSPGKRKVTNPQPCDACVTNIATVTAKSGSLTATATGNAVVCIDVPPMVAARIVDQTLVLTWEDPLSAYKLQCSGSCTADGGWTDMPNTPVLLDGKKTVQVLFNGPVQFYRLKKN